MIDEIPGLPSESEVPSEKVSPSETPSEPETKERHYLRGVGEMNWRPTKRKLLHELAKGTQTHKDAAIAAGYAPGSAGVAASRALADPEFRSELRALMDRVGATRERVLTRIREGLDATKKTYASSDGIITDQREDPDWEARGKFADRAARVRGDCGYSGQDDVGGAASVSVMIAIIREQSALRGLPL